MQPHNHLVTLDKALVRHDKVADRQEFADVIKALALERTDTSIDKAALLHLDDTELTARELKGGPSQQWRGSRADFELQYRELHWTVDGVIGHVTNAGVFNLVHAFYFDVVQRLNDARNGDWRPVAWEIIERDISAVIAVANPVGAEGWNRYGGMDMPTDKKAKSVPHKKIFLCMAFTDVAQTEPFCSWEARTGKKDGAFYQYAQTRKLGALPQSQQLERRRAEDLIERFYAVPEQEDASTGPALEPTELTPQVVEAAANVIAAGKKLGEVAAFYGVHPNTLRAAMKKAKKRAEAKPKAKPAATRADWDEVIIESAKRMLADGKPADEVAAFYQVTTVELLEATS